MQTFRAEVIAIGDELTSGVRLDTNTKWISEKLGELGVSVAFHSTVGDDLDDMVQVLSHAVERSDVIVLTGGLGPTADDLTRHAIAKVAGVSLELNSDVLTHIQGMYKKRGREMPPNNEIQAWFPNGSKVIDNPEGTAPGIEYSGGREAGSQNAFRMFALPGVPVEMKQMWQRTVEPAIKADVGDDRVIHHHTIHCFGTGESQIETMLPDIVARGRDPQVGITASSATISLRISTRGDSIKDCVEKMHPTITTIHDCLGELVYGENGITLQQVVVELLKQKTRTLAIVDAGTEGEISRLIWESDSDRSVLINNQSANSLNDLKDAALDIAERSGTRLGLAIGKIDRDTQRVDAGESYHEVAIVELGGSGLMESGRFRFGGHSGWREVRASKEVLNFLRLRLRDLG